MSSWKPRGIIINSMGYGTRRINAAFRRAFQLSIPWAEEIQFLVLILIYLRSILILYSRLCLGLSKGLFPVAKCTCYNFESTPTFFHSGYITCPSQFLDLITLTILGERYKLWSSSMWSLLHSPFSSLLGTNKRNNTKQNKRIFLLHWHYSPIDLLNIPSEATFLVL